VVGERSYGKGAVQKVLPLEGGESFLKLTVETYFRPSGKNMHKFKGMSDDDDWGVTPDEGMEVDLSPEEYAAWELDRRERDLNSRVDRPRPEGVVAPKEDKQLTRAVEVLKSKLAEDGAGEPAPAP